MKDLLIIKTIVDGFNIDMCVSFAKQQDLVGIEKCDFEAKEKKVSVYVDEK